MDRSKMPDFNEFDPNGCAEVSVWAVWTGHEFYVKAKRGGCITKMSRCARAKLYELTAYGWVCHAHKDLEKERNTCQMCGLVGVAEAWEDRHQQMNHWRDDFSSNDAYRWERKSGAIIKPPKLWFLCPGCVNRTGW